MAPTSDLRQVRQRVIQLTVFRDGLWDILLGMIFLLVAVYPVSREVLGPTWNIVLFLSLLAVLVAGQLLIRRQVSVPRVGFASARRTPLMKILLVVVFLMVLLTFGLVLATAGLLGDGPDQTVAAVPSPARGYLVELIVLLVMGALFSALAFSFGVRRLYVYGWMIGLANLASIYMEHNAGWTVQVPLAGAAMVILIIGIVHLARFLRQYPVREGES